MKDILTEYDYYTINIYGQEIKLVYRIRQYQLLKKQDKAYIKNLRNNGYKIIHRRNMNKNDEVEVNYYKLYCLKIIGLDYRQKVINKILQKLNPINKTIENEIEEKWRTINFHKTTKDELLDKEAIILEILSAYYMGTFEGNNILNASTWRKFNDYEVAELNECAIPKDGKINREKFRFVKEIYTKKKFKKFEKRHKAQVKRWRSSCTYKLNKLFSFDNHKNQEAWWDWMSSSWHGFNKELHWQREGLVCNGQPYIAQWCYTNQLNEFSFNEEVYKIYGDIISKQDYILVIALCKNGYEKIILKNGVMINKPKKIVENIYFYDMDVCFLDKITANNIISDNGLIKQI